MRVARYAESGVETAPPQWTDTLGLAGAIGDTRTRYALMTAHSAGEKIRKLEFFGSIPPHFHIMGF